jgi:hypothetical protein
MANVGASRGGGFRPAFSGVNERGEATCAGHRLTLAASRIDQQRFERGEVAKEHQHAVHAVPAVHRTPKHSAHTLCTHSWAALWNLHWTSSMLTCGTVLTATRRGRLGLLTALRVVPVCCKLQLAPASCITLDFNNLPLATRTAYCVAALTQVFGC